MGAVPGSVVGWLTLRDMRKKAKRSDLAPPLYDEQQGVREIL